MNTKRKTEESTIESVRECRAKLPKNVSKEYLRLLGHFAFLRSAVNNTSGKLGCGNKELTRAYDEAVSLMNEFGEMTTVRMEPYTIREIKLSAQELENIRKSVLKDSKVRNHGVIAAVNGSSSTCRDSPAVSMNVQVTPHSREALAEEFRQATLKISRNNFVLTMENLPRLYRLGLSPEEQKLYVELSSGKSETEGENKNSRAKVLRRMRYQIKSNVGISNPIRRARRPF